MSRGTTTPEIYTQKGRNINKTGYMTEMFSSRTISHQILRLGTSLGENF
jgi:hypothetical protein